MLLDRWNANDKLLAEWLGRFVAKAEWQANAFAFFLRNDQQQQLADVACQPATAADLRGPLKRELAELQARLRKAKPSASETPLYDFVSRGLLEGPGSFVSLNCQLFKYRDVSGIWRLVWCYGFEPTIKRGDATPLICPLPECLMLQMRHPGQEAKCEVCDKPFPAAPPKKRSQTPLVAVLLLLLLAGGLGGAYFYLSRSASLVGRVTRLGTGEPITNAYIDLAGRHTQTDANGQFRLAGLPWGDNRVLAKAPGYQDVESVVALAMRQESQLDLTLSGAAQLKGRVVYRTGDEQRPIAKATVKLAGSKQTTTSDDDGRFQLSGLFPGATELHVVADGFVDQEIKGEAAVGGAPVDVVLAGSCEISGRIVYAADSKTPIADAELSAMETGAQPVRSDADGGFRLTGVPPTEIKIQINAAGFIPQTLAVTPGEEPIVIPLSGNAVLTGEVLRTDTKSPVAGAEVRLTGTPFTAKTNEQGQFRLTGVRSGPTRLTATASGLAGTLAQDLAAEQTTAVKILLAGSLTVHGRVIEANTKEPIAGATVALVDGNTTARTDAQGRYTLTGLVQDAAKLAVSAAGYLPEQAEIDPSPDQPQLDDIALRRAASLEGRVLSAKDQKPIVGAEVAFGASGTKATTNAQGEFKLSPLPTGEGELTISAARHYPLRLTTELAAGDQTLNDLTLAQLASIKGRVLRAIDKTPLENAIVGIAESGEKVTTDAEGNFEIPEAPAGAVHLASIAEGYEAKRWKHTLLPGEQTLDDVLLEGNTQVKGHTFDGGTANQWVPGAKIEVIAGNFRKQLVSDAKGTFDVGKLPPGPVEMKASAPGFLDAKVTKDVSPDDASIDLTLLPLVDVTGLVTSAGSKQPVDKAEVSMTSAAGEHKAVTGKDGMFKASGVAAGPIEIRTKAPGFASAKRDAKVVPKGARLEVPLQPLLAIQGTVVDAEKPKQGIAKATVRLSAGDVTTTVTSDGNGKFTVKLPPGKVTGQAEAAGYCETPIEATLAAAKPALEIRMPAGRTLSGTVINAVNNEPIEGATIEVAHGGKTYRGQSDAAGAFEIKSVPATAAAANVTAAGFEPLAATLPAGKDPWRLVLSPALAAGEVRVVLTWGEKPRDIDGHLYGPAVAGKRLHVSFKNRMADGATLDVDGKEGYGPETITINRPGKYEYFVAHPENLGSQDGDGLARSAAEVRMYFPGSKGEAYRVPTKATGPLWHVLDLTIDPGGSVKVERKQGQFSSQLPE
jgi:hypothetical protein